MTTPAAVRRLRATALWSIAATAMLAAYAAVVGTAESLSLQNITYAQAYTSSYLLLQPAAAAVFFVALMLALHESIVPGWRAAAALAAAPSLLAAELFLAGPEGPLLPGAVWILVKALGLVALVLAGRRFFRTTPYSRLVAIAGAAVLAGLANVAVTVLRTAS